MRNALKNKLLIKSKFFLNFFLHLFLSEILFISGTEFAQ